MVEFVLVLVVLLPLAWFASEFQSRVWLRLTLGCLAILLSFGVAWVVGSLDRLNSNAWYGAATKDLVQNTILQLEAGNSERVLTELRSLRSEFHPSYEDRCDYDRLVAVYVSRLSDNPIVHRPGDPSWTNEAGSPGDFPQ